MPLIVTPSLDMWIEAFTASAAEIRPATRTALVAAGHVVEAEIKRQLTTSSHRKGTPTPSAPGQPPSLVSGSLRRSVSVYGPYGSATSIYVDVGPSMIYGRIQELGGVAGHGSVLPARPYVAPGAARALDRAREVFVTAWTAAIPR